MFVGSLIGIRFHKFESVDPDFDDHTDFLMSGRVEPLEYIVAAQMWDRAPYRRTLRREQVAARQNVADCLRRARRRRDLLKRMSDNWKAQEAARGRKPRRSLTQAEKYDLAENRRQRAIERAAAPYLLHHYNDPREVERRQRADRRAEILRAVGIPRHVVDNVLHTQLPDHVMLERARELYAKYMAEQKTLPIYEHHIYGKLDPNLPVRDALERARQEYLARRARLELGWKT